MDGFFTSSDSQTSEPIHRVSGCGACKLHRTCNSPRMEPTGKGEKGILILAEAPGKTEDERNIQLVGDAGQLLRRKLRRFGVDLDKDCRKTNAICCRPEGNRTPTSFEVECCRPRVWREIETFKPKLILLLGGSAVQSFLSHRWKKDLGGIFKWRGWQIPDRDTKAWVAPMFHPSYVLRSESNPAVDLTFTTDLEDALTLLDKPFPEYLNEEQGVEILETDKQVYDRLWNIYEYSDFISIDIETTGLKPHAQGHKILTCSITTEPDRAYAFNFPTDRKTQALFRRILLEDRISKTGHNIKYEDNWFNVILGTPVESWYWDSMLAAHILDNRGADENSDNKESGVKGLKFQTYVNFGLMDYSSHLDQYMKSDTKKFGGNGFNRNEEAPRKELLVYNGVDTIVQYRLALKQMEILGVSL